VESVSPDPGRFVTGAMPDPPRPNWSGWEPMLLAAGYEFCLFDGLNRFYALQEEPSLRAALETPASVLDGYVPRRQTELESWLTAARSRAEAAEAETRQLAANEAGLQAALQNAQSKLEADAFELNRLQAALEASEDGRRKLESVADDLTHALNEHRQTLRVVEADRDALAQDLASHREALASHREALDSHREALASHRDTLERERAGAVREIAAWRERVATMERTAAWRWRARLIRWRRSLRLG